MNEKIHCKQEDHCVRICIHEATANALNGQLQDRDGKIQELKCELENGTVTKALLIVGLLISLVVHIAR